MKIIYKYLICGVLSLLYINVSIASVINVPGTGGNIQVFGEMQLSGPDGPGDIHSSAFGQTFRLHEGDGQYLDSISFGIYEHSFSEGHIDFTLHIYEWDGTKVVGSELFGSNILSTINTDDVTTFDINLNNIKIEIETEYMWLLNVVHDGVPSTGGVVDSYGGTYDDGSFFTFDFNDGNLNLLGTDGWSEVCPTGCRDLAFTLNTVATSPVPLPSSLYLFLAGILGLIKLGRKK